MDAGLFIYFTRDPGHNIYFKVFDGQDIYLKKLPATLPPPPASILRPLTKKGLPNSTDCHTKHKAMLHGLWPSNVFIYMSVFVPRVPVIWSLSEKKNY